MVPISLRRDIYKLVRHEALAEIIFHPVFESLKDFRHHGGISCHEHSLTVALLTYQMAEKRGCNSIAATRGALLHDFYLYDWHTGGPGLHGFRHPAISLENALRYFSLNNIERDAILRHMWPLTPVPPRFRESMIVSLADKYATMTDYLIKGRFGRS